MFMTVLGHVPFFDPSHKSFYMEKYVAGHFWSRNLGLIFKAQCTQLLFLFSNPDAAEGNYPDSKVHGANMGPIWGRQDPGGPHVGPMKLAISVYIWVYIFGNDVAGFRGSHDCE